MLNRCLSPRQGGLQEERWVTVLILQESYQNLDSYTLWLRTILNGRKLDKESYVIFLKTLIQTVYIEIQTNKKNIF